MQNNSAAREITAKEVQRVRGGEVRNIPVSWRAETLPATPQVTAKISSSRQTSVYDLRPNPKKRGITEFFVPLEIGSSEESETEERVTELSALRTPVKEIDFTTVEETNNTETSPSPTLTTEITETESANTMASETEGMSAFERAMFRMMQTQQDTITAMQQEAERRRVELEEERKREKELRQEEWEREEARRKEKREQMAELESKREEAESKRRREELDRLAKIEENRLDIEKRRIEAEKVRMDTEKKRIEEELKQRKEAEERKEKLSGLSNYKSGCDLQQYLTQFESIMAECKIDDKKWNSILYPRLDVTLAERMRPLKEIDKSYQEVKTALLKSVGATPAAFGQQVYELSAEKIKHKNAVQIMEHLKRLSDGWMQGTTTLEEAKFVIVKTMLRHCLPHNGLVFLENKNHSNLAELTESLDSWLSTRQNGDFMKAMNQQQHSKYNEKRSEHFRNSQSHHSKENRKVSPDQLAQFAIEWDIKVSNAGSGKREILGTATPAATGIPKPLSTVSFVMKLTAKNEV